MLFGTDSGPKPLKAPKKCADFPLVISKSGSYILTGNIEVPLGCIKSAIEVTADFVSLDLGGFVVEGPCDPDENRPECLNTTNGVAPDDVRGIKGDGHKGLTVKNGTIRHMPDNAINTGSECKIEQVRAVGNQGEGIGAAEGCLILNNIVAGNTGSGIECEDGCSVIGNLIAESGYLTVTGEPGFGVECDTSTVVDSCFLSKNVFRANRQGCSTGSNVSAGDNSCDGVLQ